MKKDYKIVPVLLGGDLNAYSVALAFREAFSVNSHAFMRYRCGATENSDFIKTHICSGIDNVKIAVPELLKFARENYGKQLFLIPCADWYVEMLQQGREALSKYYKIHVPDFSLWKKLSDKCAFYEMMKKEGILYPDSVFFSRRDKLTEKKLSVFEYPAVIKPSNSSEYWRNPFYNMKKIYFPKNADEGIEIINQIFGAGYKSSVILQKLVGNENGNRVLTSISDNNGRVIRAVYGDVILMERGDTSYGNHSAIVTLPLDDICFRLIGFLNKIKYTGIANFDIMADGKDTYVLEINTRQGRCCDYLRCAGVNIAKIFYDIASGTVISPKFLNKEIYWRYPPHKSVAMFSGSKNLERAEYLRVIGEEYTPYENKFEGIKRKLYVFIHNARLRKTMQKNLLKNKTQFDF